MQQVVEKLFGPACATQEEKDKLREGSHGFAKELVQLSTITGLGSSSFVERFLIAITKFVQSMWKENRNFLGNINEDDLRFAMTRAKTLMAVDQTDFAQDVKLLANVFGLNHNQMVEGSKIEVEGQFMPRSIKQMASAFDSFIAQNKQAASPDDKKIAILEKISELYKSASDKLIEGENRYIK